MNAALSAGYERMAAWSDLLDRINVFPVADDDTGRNLRLSLAPLRLAGENRRRTAERLTVAATGNSGNIAAGFFSGFLEADPESAFAAALRQGRNRAWEAVAQPRSGTMLTAFDALAENGAPSGNGPVRKPEAIIGALREAVLSTAEILPAMKRAGVVDAGALGVYLFFEGFFAEAAGADKRFAPLTNTFRGRLTVAEGFRPDPSPRFCVDTVVRTEDTAAAERAIPADLGKSLVVLPGKEGVKIHLHTDRRRQVRKMLETLGPILSWSDEAIAEEGPETNAPPPDGAIHVMTDAAGSISRAEARKFGITLLDSYLVFKRLTAPETLVAPERLYDAMRRGERVTTAQASLFERHQWYHSVLSRHDRVLYLCVGSVYTGNFEAASAWKRENDPQDRFTVLDSGAASGRLAVATLATARCAARAKDPAKVASFARKAAENSREYLFLDRLRYLAAGGRLSKTRGFFGDLLGKKPVITPAADGAIRAGIVRDKNEQLDFALKRLDEQFGPRCSGLIYLEHSDNPAWIVDSVRPEVERRFTRAEVRVGPLSLTSGAHMGPGTWGVAFLPEPAES